MGDATNRATIEALVAAMNGRDLAALDRVFTEDVVMEWPQSGERIALEIAYWAKPFPAPDWRAPWIERVTPPRA